MTLLDLITAIGKLAGELPSDTQVFVSTDSGFEALARVEVNAPSWDPVAYTDIADNPKLPLHITLNGVWGDF